MRIGTCVNLTAMDGIAQKFATLRENGFDSCQLLSWNPAVWTDENADTLKAMQQEYGITVSAFWCGWEGPSV